VEAATVAVVDDGGDQEADQEGSNDAAEEADLGGVAGLAAGVEVEDAEAEDAVADRAAGEPVRIAVIPKKVISCAVLKSFPPAQIGFEVTADAIRPATSQSRSSARIRRPQLATEPGPCSGRPSRFPGKRNSSEGPVPGRADDAMMASLRKLPRPAHSGPGDLRA